MNGIILLAHGSRDPQWVSPFEKIRAEVESCKPDCAVALAYLENTTDFAGAVDDLVQRESTTSIAVVPLFLGPGGHVRGDVPQLIERASAKHPRIKFDVKPFVGDARGARAGSDEIHAAYRLGAPVICRDLLARVRSVAYGGGRQEADCRQRLDMPRKRSAFSPPL